jgi:hypothetical protein
MAGEADLFLTMTGIFGYINKVVSTSVAGFCPVDRQT